MTLPSQWLESSPSRGYLESSRTLFNSVSDSSLTRVESRVNKNILDFIQPFENLKSADIRPD